jgi:hypothetical protein
MKTASLFHLLPTIVERYQLKKYNVKQNFHSIRRSKGHDASNAIPNFSSSVT